MRDEVVDFVTEGSEKTGIPVRTFLRWIGLDPGKYYDWCRRYGRANEHNGKIPRDFWLDPDERAAILDFHEKYPLEGYRRLCFMMLDADVVAVRASQRVIARRTFDNGWFARIFVDIPHSDLEVLRCHFCAIADPDAYGIDIVSVLIER